MFSTFRNLSRTVIALGVVSFFTDVSSEMIVPLLPAFLASLGGGAATLGLIEGVAETTSALLRLYSGLLADRVRRKKPLVIAGYAISSLVRPLYALALLPWHVLTVRFVDRIGKGIRSSPRDALIADVTPPDQRGRAYGLQRGMDHLGAVVGPLVAFTLMTGLSLSMRTVFALALLPAVAALVILFKDVQEPAKAAPAAPPTRMSILPPKRPRYRRFLLAEFLFALGGSADAFLLLRAHDLGVATRLLPVLWAALHVVKATLSPLLGALSDRIGRPRVIATGWLVYALVYLAFGFATAAWQVWALFLVYGTYFALTEGAERALVSELVPAGERGRAFGSYYFVVAIAALPASAGFGGIWKHFGAPTAFFAGAALALCALLLLVFLVGLGPRAVTAAPSGDPGD